jgi:lipoprotein-releasing system permease protein
VLQPRIAGPAPGVRATRPEGIGPVYKLLLCIRYLQTRYLAFICIVSVMLGVATLIVVNAVMSGFSTKLKDRLHGVLSDVVIDTDQIDGFYIPKRNPDGTERAMTPDELMAIIKASPAGPKIEAVAPTIEVFAIFQFQINGQVIAKPVKLLGIDPAGRASVGSFSEFLVYNSATPQNAFDLTPEALNRHEDNQKRFEELERAKERRRQAQNADNVLVIPGLPGNQPPAFNPADLLVPPVGPRQFDLQPIAPRPKPLVHDGFTPPAPAMDINVGTPKPRLFGVVPGYALAHFRYRDANGNAQEQTALYPGDEVTLTTLGGTDLKPVWGNFIVTDYIKTEMSEYDSGYVYVPLDQLQRIRGMSGRVTAFQFKLKNYERDKVEVVNELRKLFPQPDIHIDTWEGHQGPLLEAIEVERSILNLLLFMIVGVAGFSILAIFTMIVSEKFRDIGILKSLGASSRGVMSIFMGYGLLLGTVGCAFGTIAGLLITEYINEIEAFLTRVTGKAVFPRDVYYFKEIPTNVDPWSVIAVNLGATAIAVVFSLLPAYRAARLHPVRALRFE